MSPGGIRPLGKSLDVQRFERFIAGETALEIAEADGITPKNAEKSIRQGMLSEQARGQAELVQLQTQSAIDAEHLRKKVRETLKDKVPVAIETLLSGARTVVSKKNDGTLQSETFVDPDVVAVGLQEFRRTVAMDQKPGPAVAITNITQTNVQNNGDAGLFDFESALEEIRRKQGKVIDVAPEPLVPNDTRPLSEHRGVPIPDDVTVVSAEEAKRREEDPWGDF
jgi:hypothetical protein